MVFFKLNNGFKTCFPFLNLFKAKIPAYFVFKSRLHGLPTSEFPSNQGESQTNAHDFLLQLYEQTLNLKNAGKNRVWFIMGNNYVFTDRNVLPLLKEKWRQLPDRMSDQIMSWPPLHLLPADLPEHLNYHFSDMSDMCWSDPPQSSKQEIKGWQNLFFVEKGNWLKVQTAGNNGGKSAQQRTC